MTGISGWALRVQYSDYWHHETQSFLAILDFPLGSDP